MKKVYWLGFFILMLMILLKSDAFAEQNKKVPAFGLPKSESQLVRGKKVYENYCLGCHGIQGDGKGDAAGFLDPKPRNFVEAQYKFTSAPSGMLPTDADLFRVITNGLHRTSMPSWKLLPEQQRWDVIAYIKTFAKQRFSDESAMVIPTVIAEDPFKSGSVEDAISKGEKAYHGVAACYSCHAAYISPEKINEARATYSMPAQDAFRTNLGIPEAKEDSSGALIKPPDFTWDAIKSGNDLENLYRVIANGISGTAMPSWKGILSEEDLWGMAYYVRHLSEKRPALVTEKEIQARREKLYSSRTDAQEIKTEGAN